MKNKGFTLIELMVVIVIIGILSAVAIPKLFGMSAKAKVAEAPQTISTWSKLQDTYFMEKGYVNKGDSIGFKAPDSKTFTYDANTAADKITSSLINDAGDCKSGAIWGKTLTVANGAITPSWQYPKTSATGSQTTKTGNCALLTPNFGS